MNFCCKQRELYEKLRNQLDANRIEKKRTGGSSGCTQINKVFYKTLCTPGFFPRRNSAVFLGELDNNISWRCHSVSEERQLNIITYSHPIEGGKFVTSINKKTGICQQQNSLPSLLSYRSSVYWNVFLYFS